jgi:tetratricopeptide (TPR) repeat protein
MSALFKRRFATGITLAAGALLVASATPVHAQQAVSGRMRVLVPPFVNAAGGQSKMGEKIADRLKKQLNELPTHAPADDGEVKKQIKKYGLNEKEMSCVQWRQLMQYVNAELTLCGTIDESTNAVNATFHSSKGTSFEVPQFAAQSDEQVAQQVVQSFRTYARQLELVVYCNDYIQSQNWQAALDNCNQAVELNPRSVDAHYMRGSALTNLDKPEEALAAYQKVLELDPMHGDALLAAGILAAKLNRQDLSKKYFHEYLALNPGNIEVTLKVATDLANAGDPEGALALVEEIAKDDAPTTVFEYAGHFAVNAAIKKKEDTGPGAGDAALAQAKELFRKGAQHYEKVLARGDSVSPEVRQRLIIAYAESGDNAKALAAAERATAAQPNDASIWFAYATALREAKRVDEAMKALDRVAQIDPKYPNVSRTRGLLLMDAGRTQEAVAAIKAAAAAGELDESQVETLAQQMAGVTGNRLVNQGKHDEAVVYFRAARDLGKSQRTIGMANLLEGFSLVKQAETLIGASVARPTAAAARKAKPLLERAKILLEGAGGYTDQASNRALLLQQVGQFLEVADALIKSGR